MRDYLVPPIPGKTRFWSVRVQERQPNGKYKSVWRSTKKVTKDEALLFAIPFIWNHLKNRSAIDFGKLVEDGLVGEATMVETTELRPGQIMTLANGDILEASADGSFVVVRNKFGAMTRVEKPKRRLDLRYAGAEKLETLKSQKEFAKFNRLHFGKEKSETSLNQLVFDNWAAPEHGKKQSQKMTNDARRIFTVLQKQFPGKNFATMTRSDVLALFRARADQGVSTSSMEKELSALKAMVNRAIRDEHWPELKSNPFVARDVLPQGIKGRILGRKLFSDIDLEKISADLPNWDPEVRLAWTIWRTMGLRRSEPWQIKGEALHEGFRCIEIGTKSRTESDRRVLPMPTAVQALLPKEITGRLFKLGINSLVQNLHKRLAALGIPPATGKSPRSLRQGFETICSANKVPQRVTDAIMGHVNDDMQENDGENQRSRARKGVKWRYFRGNGPQPLFEAMELVRTGI